MLKRIDVTAKSLIALIEPGSCFAGTLAELAFAADRSLMLIGTREGDNRPPAAITLGAGEFRLLSDGQWPHAPANPLPRRAGHASDAPRPRSVQPIEGEEAAELGLVTFAYEDFDWDDELRVMLEERASFSPDALTGMEANLALRRPRDDGNEDLRPSDRLAELDLPAAQRDRRAGRAQALRLRRLADIQ